MKFLLNTLLWRLKLVVVWLTLALLILCASNLCHPTWILTHHKMNSIKISIIPPLCIALWTILSLVIISSQSKILDFSICSGHKTSNSDLNEFRLSILTMYSQGSTRVFLNVPSIAIDLSKSSSGDSIDLYHNFSQNSIQTPNAQWW